MVRAEQRPRLRQATLLLTFFALLLGSLPVSADGIQLRPEIPTFEANSPEEFEAHVRATYALIEQYSQNAEQPVEFELSDFETRPISVVNAEPYADLATLPNGWLLDLVRGFHTDWIEGRRTLTYEFQWRHQETDWTAFPEGRQMLSSTTGEILAEIGNKFDEYRHVKKATQYKVRVRLGERQRTYEAAFLWVKAEAPNAWYAATFDHVIQGVETVRVEKIPPTGISLDLQNVDSPLPRLTEPESGTSSPPIEDTNISQTDHVSGTPVCIRDSADEPLNKRSPNGTNGHLTGYHWSAIDFNFRCSCSETCTSRCEASSQNAKCQDTLGSLLSSSCHKFSSGYDASSEGKSSALLEGARCAAGLACAQIACLFCGCNLNVGLEVTGVTIEYAPTDADWTGNLQGAWSCGACTEQEADPNDPESGSDTGEELFFACSRPTPTSCTSPILISMSDGTLSLTSAQDGVAFDIDGDGVLDEIAWTTADSDDYFLALDHNTNGRIDSGLELFGQATHQEPSDDPNGFLALRWYDQPKRGGNADYKITAADRVFEYLLLWRDENHDGISQEHELTPLRESGIRAIDLDYFLSGRSDRHGNLLHWASMVDFEQGRRLGAMDVIFRTPEDGP